MGRARGGAPLPRPRLLLGREQVLVELLEHVGHVEERVALEAEVDEGRLHARAAPG